jgi:hypothetical protein
MKHAVALAERLAIGIGLEQISANDGRARVPRVGQGTRPIEGNDFEVVDVLQLPEERFADETAAAGEEDPSDAH